MDLSGKNDTCIFYELGSAYKFIEINLYNSYCVMIGCEKMYLEVVFIELFQHIYHVLIVQSNLITRPLLKVSIGESVSHVHQIRLVL